MLEYPVFTDFFSLFNRSIPYLTPHISASFCFQDVYKRQSKYSSPQTYRNVLPAKFWKYTISASVIPCRITFFLSTFVATYTSHAKKSVALNHTLLRITFVKEFSAGCQPRYPVKIPITTWKSLSPPRGLQLYPSCQARCPVKTSNEMEVYPAPSAAQLLMMLLHREHFCSCFYYTQS